MRSRVLRDGALSLGLALLAGLGCGGPEAEIRESLSAAERERFDLGRQLSTPCWSCHDLHGEQNKVGPSLSGVFGRRAGEAAFPGYSQAMRESGIVWHEQALREFLLDPQRVVPGTTMVASGPRHVGQVDALVFYLKKLGQARAAQSK